MNLYHLLVPHPKNNHRSKILHHTSLLLIIISFVFLSFVGVVVKNTHPEVLGISYNISEQELLNLVNFEREKNGLSKLTINAELTKAASEKAQHMFSHNYWAHFAPDGTTPWSFIKGNGYEYLYAGENLAKGYTNSVDAVDAWMNSPTHKANILSPKFKDIGFSIAEGRLEGEDTILIVQMFGSTSNNVADNSQITETSKNPIVESQSVPNDSTLGSQESLTKVVGNDPIIDVSYSTKIIVFTVLSLLVIALTIDLIVVEKNKIPRKVGNNLDHIILIILFLTFIFTNNLGNII